jgi:uncharacterized protein (DUF3084 family)
MPEIITDDRLREIESYGFHGLTEGALMGLCARIRQLQTRCTGLDKIQQQQRQYRTELEEKAKRAERDAERAEAEATAERQHRELAGTEAAAAWKAANKLADENQRLKAWAAKQILRDPSLADAFGEACPDA